MNTSTRAPTRPLERELPLGLYRLVDPAALANPYALYQRLRTEEPVCWDPFLKAWVVTRYDDVVAVLSDHRFSAVRTPSPQDLAQLGLGKLSPIAAVLVRQMLFMDASAHTRIRSLAARAFTPRRVEQLRPHIQQIVDELLRAVEPSGGMDVVADLAGPLPQIVTAELLGLPRSDCPLLKAWSADFAQVLGNFQHNPDGASRVLRSIEEMTRYFAERVQERRAAPAADSLIDALMSAEVQGEHLTDEEVIANAIMMMVGGQETTTSLIGNGTMILLQRPEVLEQVRSDPALLPSAIEEFLRYESPIQHTARMAAEDLEFRGKHIRKRQAVIAVLGAANRDPAQFPDPDRVDIRRQENRHLAFGWAAHFCFGAPLARAEAQAAFATMLRRLRNVRLATDRLEWQGNLAYRGLRALPVSFEPRQGRAHATDELALGAPAAKFREAAVADVRNTSSPV